jgi:glycosyltransferase involved in cell wall biosynthesis
MNKKHTFVIPAYKDSPYLEDCILSLKKQTLKSEILITTSTPSQFISTVVDKHEIPVIVNSDCKGMSSDWTFAYNNAKTEYVTLAHQDDIYLAKYTETCLAAAQNDINNLIVSTDYYEMMGDKVKKLDLSRIVKYLLLSPFYFKQDISSQLFKKMIILFGTPIPCATVMYNKKLIGEFKFSEEFHCNADWDAWLRLSEKKGSFIYLKSKLLIQRTHKESQTWLQIESNVRQKEDKLMFERLWPKPIARFLAALYSLSTKFYTPD